MDARQPDVDAAVNSAPPGTTFRLKPGVYRLRSIRPKDFQKFIGEKGTIISGAMVVSRWRRDGQYWVAENLPDPLRQSGSCAKGRELCRHREDLFVDGKLYPRVGSLAELKPGHWYGEAGRAYLADDPRARVVELGVAQNAFTGDAKGVVLKDLIVEKFASMAQQGAIDGRKAKDWQLLNVTARWNHGGGLRIGKGMRVIGGAYVYNGQIGIVGEGDGALVDSVEIAFNNYAGFSSGWEAGGTKFWRSDGLVIRNACVHDNKGPGLWTDIDNINVLIEGNKVFDNAGDGIKHEISFKATIRRNLSARNGRPKDNWLWGSQILVQNSSDTEVYENTVEVRPDYGNGIGLIYQNRKDRWRTRNNFVHDNTMIFLGKQGRAGMVADYQVDAFRKDKSNRFENNHFVLSDGRQKFMILVGKPRRWEDLRGRADFEKLGRISVEQRSPSRISCGTALHAQ